MAGNEPRLHLEVGHPLQYLVLDEPGQLAFVRLGGEDDDDLGAALGGFV